MLGNSVATRARKCVVGVCDVHQHIVGESLVIYHEKLLMVFEMQLQKNIFALCGGDS